MYNKVLKQILVASAFLALAFFVVDICKVYIEFTPDRFNLSLAQISFSLIIVLAYAILKSIVLITPLLVISIIFSAFRVLSIYNLNVRLNALLYAIISTIALTIYYIETLFNKYKIKTLIAEELVNNINLRYSLCIIILFILAVSFICFRKVKSKNLLSIQRRSLFSFVVALSLIGISYLEFSRFQVLKKHKNSIINYYHEILKLNDPIKDIKSVDYKQEFKKYLDLNEIYEDEANYLKLLKRKTSFKSNQYNIVMLYVDSLNSAELVSQLDVRLFTFDKVLGNFSDPLKSIRYIKLNLPPVVTIDSNIKDSSVKTHYSNIFKDYALIEESRLISLSVKSHFTIFHLKSLNLADYTLLNEMLKTHSDNTIFIFTTNLKKQNKYNYIDQSTFISFHIPASLGSVDFKADKIIGQEDIMTTIINLALSEKEYLSLGDDIFIDSNSNAINENICADDTGLYIFDEKIKKNINLDNNLTIRCISTKHISEFILQQSVMKI